jgi:hypothetical protein
MLTDPFTAGLSSLKDLLPQTPETRMERLIGKAMLMGMPVESEELTRLKAAEIVRFARYVEGEIEAQDSVKIEAIHETPAWSVLTFVTQADFEAWVAELLQVINRTVAFNASRAGDYLAAKVAAAVAYVIQNPARVERLPQTPQQATAAWDLLHEPVFETRFGGKRLIGKVMFMGTHEPVFETRFGVTSCNVCGRSPEAHEKGPQAHPFALLRYGELVWHFSKPDFQGWLARGLGQASFNLGLASTFFDTMPKLADALVAWMDQSHSRQGVERVGL